MLMMKTRRSLACTRSFSLGVHTSAPLLARVEALALARNAQGRLSSAELRLIALAPCAPALASTLPAAV